MKQQMKNLLIGLAAGATLAAAGTVGAQERLRLVTSPAGSIIHATGSAIASVLSKETDMTVLAAPMGGPQVYVPQVNSGQAHFALLNAADSYDALRAATAYKTPNKNLRLVGIGFTNEVGVLVREDSDIRKAADLKGRRVTGVFSVHKTCEMLATAQLANAGLTWDDVEVVPVTNSPSAVRAVGEGRAEAALCGALGQGVVEEVNAQRKVRFISLDGSPEAIARTRAEFPAGRINEHKAGSNTALPEDTTFWSYPFYLIASVDTSDEAVYEAVKTVYEEIDQLRQISGVFKRWDPAKMMDSDITLPVHEGAIRFYKEKGMWNEQVQKAHDENLALTR